jgi:hypothetical protein
VNELQLLQQRHFPSFKFNYQTWCGLSEGQVSELQRMCPGSDMRSIVSALIYLHTGLTQERIADLLGMKSQQDASRSIDAGRRALVEYVVPRFLSWPFAFERSQQEDPEVVTESKCIVIVDTTLLKTNSTTIPKLRRQQRSEYIQHQSVKFFVAVTRSGRFVVLDGPYEAETSDSLILLEQLLPGMPLRTFIEKSFEHQPNQPNDAEHKSEPILDSTEPSVAADRGFLNAAEVLHAMARLLVDERAISTHTELEEEFISKMLADLQLGAPAAAPIDVDE